MTASPSELANWHPRLVALAAGAAGTDGAHDASHLERVWRNAQALLARHPEAGRALGMERLAVLTDFRAQFVAEWRGAAPT